MPSLASSILSTLFEMAPVFLMTGKFRHLPVVDNGEVIALLDIAKCLYDAIARMERAAEKGKAIAAAVEGVEKNWGTPLSGLWNPFKRIHTLTASNQYSLVICSFHQ